MKRSILFVALLLSASAVSCQGIVRQQNDAARDTIRLQNEFLSLGFEPCADGLLWTSLKDVSTNTEFLTADGREPFWKAHILLPTGDARELTSLSCGNVTTRLYTQDGRRFCRADWGEYEPVKGHRMTAHVIVSLGRGDRTSRWTWWVECPAGCVVREIEFPCVPSLNAEKLSLAVPRGWGLDIDNLSGRKAQHFTYPAGGSLAMPFVVLHCPQAAVYIGTPDPEGAMRRFSVVGESKTGSVRAAVTSFPSDLLNPCARIGTTCDIEVGVFRDWMTASKHYRDSVVRQTAWGKAARLTGSGRRAWTEDVDAWYVAGAELDAEPDNIARFAELMGVPVAVHWYNWHQIPFDDHYPEYFPAKTGFKNAVRKVQQAGVRVMPYINARLWDPANDSWREEKAQTWCARRENGDTYLEVYGSKVPLAVMCPYTSFWQDKVQGIVKRLFDEFEVDAVYLDQISAAAPVLCFARNHGHPPGGGSLWTTGYRKLLHRIRSDLKPGQLLTTEEFSDPFADLLDAFLMVNTPESQGEIIPVVPAVYSGRVVAFGFQYLRDTDFTASLPFRAKMARAFCWGSALGWVGSQILNEDQRDNGSYMAELARVRRQLHDSLVYGELLRHNILGEVSFANVTTGSGNETVVFKTASVHSALWRGRSGSLAVVLTNLSDESQTSELKLNLSQYGVASFPVQRFEVRSTGTSEPQLIESPHISEQIDLAPRSALAIVFATAAKPVSR